MVARLELLWDAILIKFMMLVFAIALVQLAPRVLALSAGATVLQA